MARNLPLFLGKFTETKTVVTKSGLILPVNLFEPDIFLKYAGILKAGDDAQLMIAKRYKKRSDGTDPKRGNQNGWLWAEWGPYAAIAKHRGEFDLNEVHEDMVMEFRGQKGGLKSGISRHTSEWDTVLFAEYQKWLIMFSAKEWGLFIREPDRTYTQG